jgi:hypothetical protein
MIDEASSADGPVPASPTTMNSGSTSVTIPPRRKRCSTDGPQQRTHVQARSHGEEERDHEIVPPKRGSKDDLSLYDSAPEAYTTLSYNSPELSPKSGRTMRERKQKQRDDLIKVRIYLKYRTNSKKILHCRIRLTRGE